MVDNMKIELTAGQPVKGTDFFNREEIINEIWNSLERSSILLVAPRKFGKTSIMFKLRDNPKNGFTSLFFDVEHIESPQEFIIEVLEEIQRNEKLWKRISIGLKSFLKTLGDRVEEVEIDKIRVKLREGKDLNWKNLGKQLIKLLAKQEKKLVLILDEFPEMVKLMIERDRKNSSNETVVFLSWLKKLRLTMPGDLKLRFLVGGSISLENIVNQIHCGSKIADMKRIKVGPFSEENAALLVKALFDGEGVTMDDTTQEAILKSIGTPIPYFAQIMVSALVRESRNLKKDLSPEFVEEIYFNYLLGSDYKNYFEHYYSRLAEYYVSTDQRKDMVNAAKALLTEMSIVELVPKRQLYQIYLDETGQTRDEDGFGELMALLEDEFYLEYVADEESYRFYSKLLRDWWYRHFGMLKGGVRVVAK